MIKNINYHKTYTDEAKIRKIEFEERLQERKFAAEREERKSKKWTTLGIVIVILACVIGYFVLFNGYFDSEKAASDRQEQELQTIVDEVTQDIEDSVTLWLRKNTYPYWIGGHAPSGFVPYLLGITRVNPLPTELGGQNLVWQEFCGYGRAPLYEIHLSAVLRPRIIEWLKDHWLSKINHYEWKELQPYEPSCIRRGNMYFRFDLDDQSKPEKCDPSVLCREDIFFYLKKHGFIDKDAFRGMNSVRKGKGFPVITAEMRMAEDNWILKECENVRWLPSRAQLLEQWYFETQFQLSSDGAFSPH